MYIKFFCKNEIDTDGTYQYNPNVHAQTDLQKTKFTWAKL